MKVGVIGLGSMGMGAALNLCRAGHEVIGCERRHEAWSRAGAGRRPLRGDARGDRRLRPPWCSWSTRAGRGGAVRRGWLPGRLPRGAVVLCCTTVAPEAARAAGRAGGGTGRLYLDAPVSGGAVGARAGKMTVMAAGAPRRSPRRSRCWSGGGQGLAPGRRARRGQHGEDGQPAARRRAHRRGGGGDGARHPRRGRPADLVRRDQRFGRQLVDVAEPRAAHPGRRRHAAVLGQHLRQGSRHRARPGPGADLPAADGRPPRTSCSWPRPPPGMAGGTTRSSSGYGRR